MCTRKAEQSRKVPKAIWFMDANPHLNLSFKVELSREYRAGLMAARFKNIAGLKKRSKILRK